MVNYIKLEEWKHTAKMRRLEDPDDYLSHIHADLMVDIFAARIRLDEDELFLEDCKDASK